MRTAQQICDVINKGKNVVATLREVINLVDDRDHWRDRALRAEGFHKEQLKKG